MTKLPAANIFRISSWSIPDDEVTLVVEGYSYFITKTPQQTYEQVDYTKAYYSIDFLEQEAENLSWQ